MNRLTICPPQSAPNRDPSRGAQFIRRHNALLCVDWGPTWTPIERQTPRRITIRSRRHEAVMVNLSTNGEVDSSILSGSTSLSTQKPCKIRINRRWRLIVVFSHFSYFSRNRAGKAVSADTKLAQPFVLCPRARPRRPWGGPIGAEVPHAGRGSIVGRRPSHRRRQLQYRQKALASCIWRGVRHSASNRRDDATTIHRHCARQVATFSRFAL